MAAHNAGVNDVTGGLTTRESDVHDVPPTGLAAVSPTPPAAAPAPPAARPEAPRRPSDNGPAKRAPAGLVLALTGQVPAVVVKAAPGLPAGTAPDGWETQFVADARDLKEAVLWSPALATRQPGPRSCRPVTL